MSTPKPPGITTEEAYALVRDEALWSRGKRLYEQGAVENATRRGRLLLGSIEGSAPDPYTISLEAPALGKRTWHWHCTCPYFEIYGGPCKHNVALLLQWAGQPESFDVEASLDEQLAGEERGRWLALVRETLRESPALQRLLAIEPERKRALGRPLNLAPYEEQLNYALTRYSENQEKQQQLFEGILETAAGYLRVEDAANGARLATLLADRLVRLPSRSRSFQRLLLNTLTLLEASALDATWDEGEQRRWLTQLMQWWEEAEWGIADRLMDLILHCYRREDTAHLERWLRGLLRKPVQGNRLSNAAWRQRILAFLLAFYESNGRINAFLDLCWEEGEDALAARKLVEQGDSEAALELAHQGLGGCNAHREVAAALLKAGEREAALRVAHEGLRYDDRGRGTLLAWLAAQALHAGDTEQALSLAQQAWEAGPSLERYLLLREAAQRMESWHRMQGDLHTALEHQGEHALLVEILMEEEAWQSAAVLLPASGARRDDLTMAVARGLATSAPEEALYLLFDLAELRTEGKTRVAYANAAHALLAAQTLAGATGHNNLFQARLQTFLEANARRPALLDEVRKALPDAALYQNG